MVNILPSSAPNTGEPPVTVTFVPGAGTERARQIEHHRTADLYRRIAGQRRFFAVVPRAGKVVLAWDPPAVQHSVSARCRADAFDRAETGEASPPAGERAEAPMVRSGNDGSEAVESNQGHANPDRHRNSLATRLLLLIPRVYRIRLHVGRR